MIESIKASSDCLSLRLPFESGTGDVLVVSGLRKSVWSFFLKKWRSVLYKCDSIPVIHPLICNTKWWSIYCNHYKKKSDKVGWHDCISAVF